MLTILIISGCSNNCDYKSHENINSKVSVGMSMNEVVNIFGDVDSKYTSNFDYEAPCRTVDVIRYKCNEETTAIGFCDGVVVSIKKE